MIYLLSRFMHLMKMTAMKRRKKNYEELNNITSENKNFTDTLLVLGDFNGRVSNRKEDNICGLFGLGDARTDNGEGISY